MNVQNFQISNRATDFKFQYFFNPEMARKNWDSLLYNDVLSISYKNESGFSYKFGHFLINVLEMCENIVCEFTGFSK